MELIGSIPKSDSAEVRVMRGKWRGREVVDVRIWIDPEEGGGQIATGRGVQLELSKLPELIEILQLVDSNQPKEKQHD